MKKIYMSPQLPFRANLGREVSGFRLKPGRLLLILTCLSQPLALNAIANAQAVPLATNFGTSNIATQSSPDTVTYTFSAGATLGTVSVLTAGASGFDFANAGTGTCASGTSYSTGNSCTVNVTFTPGAAGTRYGAVVFQDGSSNVLATAYLQGTGVGPQVTFRPGAESVPTSDLSDSGEIALDGAGNVYIADSSNNRVLKETFSGGGYTESTIPTSTLNYPGAVAVDGAGNVFVADTFNNRVLEETLSGVSYVETTLATSTLSIPYSVKIDGNGNLYIVDSGNNRVLLESVSASGYVETTISTSALNEPTDVAVDGSGNVFIADTGNNRVLKETLSAGSYTESVVATSTSYPAAITVDGNGSIYVVGGNTVFEETPAGSSYTESVIPSGATGYPCGLAVDGVGDVYISDSYSNRLLKEDFADPPTVNFAATSVGSTSSDSPKVVNVINSGDAGLNFSAISFPPDFPENSGATSDCTSTTTLAGLASCTLTINFTPTTPSSPLSESVTITTNALNVPGTQQAITTTGTVIP